MTSTPPPDPYGRPDPYGQYGPSSPPPPASNPQYPPPPGGGYQQPGYQQPGYQPPPGQPGGYGAPPPSGSGTNTMAIVSLVCSLAGLLVWISAPVGAILGHVAKKQIRERGEEGEGMATAGIIIGWILTGLGVLGCCGFIALAVLAESA